MFPVLNGTRDRTFLSKNRVIGGVLLTQKRMPLGSCPSLPKYLKVYFSDSCADSESSSYEPFGVDPTFVSTSSLYRATNHKYQWYDSDDINSDSGLPYGFFYDQGCVDCTNHFPVYDYPILFDVNFNVSRVSTYMTMLLDGNYIDDYTKEVKVVVPLLSFELGRYILITAVYEPVAVGNWEMSYRINVLPAVINNWTSSDPLDGWQCFLEACFLLSFFILVTIEAKEVSNSIKHTSYPFKYFLDLGNCIDWLNYGIQMGAAMYWISYVKATDNLNLSLHYDVYNDYMAVGRLTQMTDQMGRYQFLIKALEKLVYLRTMYSSCICSSLIVTCLQTLKNLDFHPKMGIITKTVTGALSDLAFFLFLFSIVQIIYSFTGVMVFGQFSDEFNTFGAAFVSNIYMLLGTYEPQDDMEMSSQPQIATMYYWSYMIITFFILLNALLAIIVDSYASVKNASEQQADVDPLSNTVNHWIRNMSMPDLADSFISDKHLFRITQDLFDVSYPHFSTHPVKVIDILADTVLTSLALPTEHIRRQKCQPTRNECGGTETERESPYRCGALFGHRKHDQRERALCEPHRRKS